MRSSQLPFGWVCFSNRLGSRGYTYECNRLNCLSAGSVSLTAITARTRRGCALTRRLNCLSAGSVSLTGYRSAVRRLQGESQLPFGWVCFSNNDPEQTEAGLNARLVSIAFRLGLFL